MISIVQKRISADGAIRHSQCHILQYFGYIILQMNPKSVNKHQEVEEETARSLQEKGRTQETKELKSQMFQMD